jgi:hypothetical protein
MAKILAKKTKRSSENNADKPKYYVLDMFLIHLEQAYT